jgi:dihydroorotase
VSTAWGVEAIRQAKARGVSVTAEATPHHLTLTDERVDGYDTNAKMNPPLRSAVDRDAVRAGLADGTLDVYATDHAPHHYDEKEQAFDDAPNGIVGLETSLGIGLTHVVGEGVTDLPTLIDRMSWGPAKAFGLPGGTLAVGAPADVTVIDPEAAWTVDSDTFLSRSRNTPFHGAELKGRTRYTIVGGAIVWESSD